MEDMEGEWWSSGIIWGGVVDNKEGEWWNMEGEENG